MSTEGPASTAPPAMPLTPGSRGRCFVCLTDEDPLSGEDWVRPCPCSLEGHQECMMSYVTELEQEGKPLRCPICKADIRVDEPIDPALILGNALHRVLNRASPWLLGGGFASGTIIGLSTYGHAALRIFAGHDGYIRFINHLERDGYRAAWHVAAVPLTAPFLIIGQSVPALGNLFFLPLAAFYSAFQFGFDEHFFSWPPSPELVIASFPYIRGVYRNLWREFVRPYEKKLDRKMAGLPEPGPEEEQNRGQQQDRDDDQERGGIIGVLDAAINLLELPDVDVGLEVQEQVVREEDLNGEEMGHRVEIEMGGFGDEEALNEALREGQAIPVQIPAEAGHQAEEEDDANEQPPADGEPEEADPAADAPQDAAPAPIVPPAQAEPAPANRQWNLQTSLRDVSNSLASALLLPAISACAGELLRMALPDRLTSLPRGTIRPGLLQQQWGRSFVGGCLYLVLKDAFRFYNKYRIVANKPHRRVRNTDKKRNRSGGGSPT